jgi:hypothetical protein
MTSIIVNQNYGHNLIKYFKYVKQKKPGNYCPGCAYVVPRDRIELPTRGFSETTPGPFNLLNLLQPIDFVYYNFSCIF